MILSFKKIIFKFLLLISLLLTSCSDDTKDDLNLPQDERVVATNISDTIIRVSVDGHQVPIYLSIPQGCYGEMMPAVVVMHGSDGMWTSRDPSSETMSGQFTQWQSILNENCIVGAFVDSYTCRGVITRSGKWRELPDNFRISAQFQRPKDANAALSLLQNLKYDNGNSVVILDDIGLLGFSDGASSVAATMLDMDRIPKNFDWTQSQNGKEYGISDGVLSPQEKPEIGFSGAVFYYGGSVGYNYFGKHPCGPEASEGNVFYPYAPMLYQIPSDDPLTENTLCLLELLEAKGAPIETHYYENVSHGFDFDGLPVSDLARKRTIDWFLKTWSEN